MRIVVDTNVFISAALKDKSLPAIAVHLALQRGTLLKSIATERQLLDVLARPYFASLVAPATRDWLATVLAASEMVNINETITACRDATDDKFLELAINGHAEFIVSGDADLLVLSPFRSIPIVSPAVFTQGAFR
jgi:uncharacterized protein